MLLVKLKIECSGLWFTPSIIALRVNLSIVTFINTFLIKLSPPYGAGTYCAIGIFRKIKKKLIVKEPVIKKGGGFT